MGSFSQTLFYGGVKRQPEIRLRSQAKMPTVILGPFLLVKTSFIAVFFIWGYQKTVVTVVF